MTDSNQPKKDASGRLARMVQEEARRMLSDAALEGDPELLAQGWERRFMADADRAREAVELYEELGYEVRTEAVHAEDVADDCEDCQLLMLLKFQTIYTRKGAPR